MTVLVLSMHRSGSSLLTALLSSSGLNPGPESDLIKGSSDNEMGFWERQDIVDLNNFILSDMSHPPWTPLPGGDNYRKSEELECLVKEKARELSYEGINIIKDPRFCLTLKLWRESIQDLKIIYLVRNPQDVARSLKKRQNSPLPVGRALWEYYNLKALESVSELPVYFVNFDDLVSDPFSVCTQLTDWLGSVGVSGLDIKKNDIDSLFSPRLVHYQELRDSEDPMNAQNELYAKIISNQRVKDFTLSTPAEQVLVTWNGISLLGYHPGLGRCIDKGSLTKLNLLSSKNHELRTTVKVLRHESNILQNETNVLRKKLVVLTGLCTRLINSKSSKVLEHIQQFHLRLISRTDQLPVVTRIRHFLDNS